MGDVVSLHPKRLTPSFLEGAVVVTWPIHLDPIRGIEGIKKRNPNATSLMSVARPVKDDGCTTCP